MGENGTGGSTVGENKVEVYATEMGPASKESTKHYGTGEFKRYSAGGKYVEVGGSEPLDPLKEDDSKDDHSLSKLKTATIFVLCFFVVEVVGGVWAGSLAVITDAAHLLTDVSVSSSCMLLYCDYTYPTVSTVVL